MRVIRKYQSLNSFLILICPSTIFFARKWSNVFPSLISRVFNTDAVPTEAGKSFQVQKAARISQQHLTALISMMCNLYLPQAWMHQSPLLNLLHLGANSPCLECLQLPGEEVHNFIMLIWSSKMQLPSLWGSHCAPRVWPTLLQGEESPWGLICKQQGQKWSWSYWILMN